MSKLIKILTKHNEDHGDEDIEITPIESIVVKKTSWADLGLDIHPEIITAFNDPEYKQPFYIETPFHQWLLNHGYAQPIPKTESSKRQQLQSLTIPELQQLCTLHNIKRSGNKEDIIKRLFPYIDPADLPSQIKINHKFNDHLKQIATTYAQQAAQAMADIKASASIKLQAITDGLDQLQVLPATDILKAIEQAPTATNTTPIQAPTQQPQRTASENSALLAFGLGTALTIGLYFLLPNMTWWIYPTTWAIISGISFGKLLEAKANENLADKNIS